MMMHTTTVQLSPHDPVKGSGHELTTVTHELLKGLMKSNRWTLKKNSSLPWILLA